MSSFTQTAIVPNATLQTGAASNTVVGAANAHTALSDSSLTSYVRFGALARLEDKVLRVQFPTPTIPAGARIFGVEVKATIRVGVGDPLLGYAVFLFWLRSAVGTATVSGQQPTYPKLPISCARPIAGTSDWQVDMSLGVYPSGPDSRAWDPATNLNQVTFDLGRDDVLPVNIDLARLSLNVLYQERATNTVTGPVDGSSTSPPVTWSTTPPLNQRGQDGYRVAVYTLDQTEESGFVPYVTPAQYISGAPGESAEKSWWLLGDAQQWPLPEGAVLFDGTYVAFVQTTTQWAGGGGDFFTEISSKQWTRNGASASPPAAPVLQSAWHNYSEMQVELVVEPATGTTALTVQHSLTGVTWFADPSKRLIPVTTGTDPVTITHRFYSTGVPNFYRLAAFKGSPLVASVAPSNQMQVTPRDDRYVLRSPDNPLLDTFVEPMPADGEGGLEVMHMQQQALHRTVGVGGQRQLPLMQWGADQGDVYELRLWFHTLEHPELLAAFDLLSKQPAPAFWQHPDGKVYWIGIGPGGGSNPTKDRFAPLPGKPSREHWRKREVTFTEIQPAQFF